MVSLNPFKQARESQERSEKRHRTVNVLCASGSIVDLSGVGMRVQSPSRPSARVGDVDSFGIKCGNESIAVAGRIVWVRRTKARPAAWEMGVRFVNVSPKVRSTLRSIAEQGGGTSIPGTEAQDRPTDARTVVSETYAGGDRRSEPTPQPDADQPSLPALKIEIENLYEVLSVGTDASRDEIRKAYHALARQLHPDVNRETDASARFTLVSKAYSVLRDDDLRARYDAMLQAANKAAA